MELVTAVELSTTVWSSPLRQTLLILATWQLTLQLQHLTTTTTHQLLLAHKYAAHILASQLYLPQVLILQQEPLHLVVNAMKHLIVPAMVMIFAAESMEERRLSLTSLPTPPPAPPQHLLAATIPRTHAFQNRI